MLSLTIKGDDQIDALLRDLPMKMSRSVVRGGMRKLAQVVAEEAKERSRSPIVTRTIGVSTNVLVNGTIISKVRTRGPGAFMAPWLEYGTAAHLISVSQQALPTALDKRGRVRSWSIGQVNKAVRRGSLVIGRAFVGQVVQHPGAHPYPFLRPAVDAKIDAGVQAMADYIRARLERHGINPPADPGGDEE
ncbi:HK97 gp10 family phage protein [Sphingomonas sp. C8-2]|nr:HK97 gp10 family phage protein [Sphingomonas sp. C8-2]